MKEIIEDRNQPAGEGRKSRECGFLLAVGWVPPKAQFWFWLHRDRVAFPLEGKMFKGSSWLQRQDPPLIATCYHFDLGLPSFCIYN